jgi:signal transduction histidine kinase
MSDIVWSINPNNESFEQLQNRMQAFAAMMLTPHDIHYDFSDDKEIKKLRLSSEERKNIFLIYKEAIHNIVKYAECKNVDIRVSIQNDQLEMQVRDNGRGFDVTQQNTGTANETLGGNGLKNMRVRADDIHAEFNIHSAINKGTMIHLKLEI